MIARARRVLAVVVIALVGGEIELLRLQQFRDVRDALVEAFEIALENDLRRAGVAVAARGLRELRAEAREFVDVALQENHVAAVERVEIAVEKLARQLVVELVVGELRALQNLRGQRGHGGLRLCRVERFA